MKIKDIKIENSKGKIISKLIIVNKKMGDEVAIELRNNYNVIKGLKKASIKNFKKRSFTKLKKPIIFKKSKELMPFMNKFDQEDWTW